jgi:hypothetical protein
MTGEMAKKDWFATGKTARFRFRITADGVRVIEPDDKRRAPISDSAAVVKVAFMVADRLQAGERYTLAQLRKANRETGWTFPAGKSVFDQESYTDHRLSETELRRAMLIARRTVRAWRKDGDTISTS